MEAPTSQQTPTVQCLRRSFSMPADESIHLELKPLARSKKKEIVYEETNEDDDDDGDDDDDESSGADSNGLNSSDCDISMRILESSKITKSSVERTTTRNPGRFIMKNGGRNIKHKDMPERVRFLKDFFTTMMDLNWIFMTVTFIGTYFVTWFIFAVLCYWVAYSNGDFILDEQTGERPKDVCFTDIENFVSMFLYSIGTQTTVGFNQNPSEDCPGAMILLMLQMVISMIIEGALVSLIYLKTSSPVKRINKLKFSDKAVICYRNDELCLLFRVCDPNEQQRIGSRIRVFIIKDKITSEGEVLKTEIELKLTNNGQQLITWPVIVCHIINETSPLWGSIKSSMDLKRRSDFELYVSIVGSSPSTTQVTEARTSYIPQEINWGHQFVNIIDYDEDKKRYVIDYSHFNTTISVDMINQGRNV